MDSIGVGHDFEFEVQHDLVETVRILFEASDLAVHSIMRKIAEANNNNQIEDTNI